MKLFLDTPGAAPHQRTAPQRLFRCLVVLLLGNAVAFVAYRSSVWHTRALINRLGGQTVTGPPPVYLELAYGTNAPAYIRPLLTSRFGHWLFCQIPVIYSVDLRAVSDPDAIAEALQIASGLDHVRELVLYNSAVRDEHLSIVAKGFPRLHSLKINRTSIGDSGIAQLSGNSTLLHINAQQTAVTNSCLRTLSGMPQLRELNVAETGITSLAPLRKANPRCHITFAPVTLSRTTDKQRAAR